MLRKLMKYELKATSRLLIPLYIVMILMSIINRFSLNLEEHQGFGVIIGGLLIATYVTTIAAVLIVTAIYMVIRFYKNLLTDEGYLMFTLPTKTHQLINSKMLITVFWIIISLAAILLSLFIAFATPETIPSAVAGIKEAIAEVSGEIGGGWVLVLIELIIVFLLGMVSNILLVYLSIAVGQLFAKHKIIGSFVAYMGIYTALQFLAAVLIFPFGAIISRINIGAYVLPQVIFPIGIVVLALGCAGFYYGTNYILSRKLNLE